MIHTKTHKAMTHTKGKWIMVRSILTTNEIEEDRRCPIATIHSMEDGKNNDQRKLESKANAKLIASAPELLEALKEAINWYEMPNAMPNARKFPYRKMLEAIKKAEG